MNAFVYTAWCSEIGTRWSLLDAPDLHVHASMTSENQFHCTRLYCYETKNLNISRLISKVCNNWVKFMVLFFGAEWAIAYDKMNWNERNRGYTMCQVGILVCYFCISRAKSFDVTSVRNTLSVSFDGQVFFDRRRSEHSCLYVKISPARSHHCAAL